MKIIYSGGYDKTSTESIKKSFIYAYLDQIQQLHAEGKKTAFVTLARPDHYYDPLLLPLYQDIAEIIDYSKLQTVKWSEYDFILLMGGDTHPLYQALMKTHFKLGSLKEDAVILSDSAGAYVLSSYFFSSPTNELRGLEVEFHKGLNSDASHITIAHMNNPHYTNQSLLEKVHTFAKEKGIRVLELEENERKLWKDGEFIDFDDLDLFS